MQSALRMTEVRRTKSPIRTDGALSNLRHERHGTSALAYTAVRCNTVLMTQNYSIDENRAGIAPPQNRSEVQQTNFFEKRRKNVVHIISKKKDIFLKN